jgi:HK97 family phage portal protein
MWPFSSRRAETRAVETSHVYLVSGGEVRSLSDPSIELLQLFGAWSPEGIPATATARAMTYPASAACVRLISSLIAECPVHAFQRTDDGGRERVRGHVVETLLNSTASPWCESTEFLREMTVTALHNGHAYARVVRTGRDRMARELHPLASVTVERDDATGAPSYLIPRKGGGQERLGFRDVIHLKSPTGGAPTQQVARAIELGLQLELATLNLFRNGGRPSGLLSFKTKVDPVTATAARDQWLSDVKEGLPAVLGNDCQFTPIAFSSTDSQTIDNRRLQVLEVARGYGVSPTLLAELEDASLNNSEALGRQFVSYTLAPWLTAWVAAVSRCLLSEAERASTYVEFETAGLVSADLKARFEALRQAVGGPWLAPDEARALENRPAIEGGAKLNLPQGAPAPTAKESVDA